MEAGHLTRPSRDDGLAILDDGQPSVPRGGARGQGTTKRPATHISSSVPSPQSVSVVRVRVS